MQGSWNSDGSDNAGNAKPGHEPYPREGYVSGEGCPALPARTRISLPAAPPRPSWATGSRASKVRHRRASLRLLLASTPRPELWRCPSSAKQSRVLDTEAGAYSTSRPPEPGCTGGDGLERGDHLGLRDLRRPAAAAGGFASSAHRVAPGAYRCLAANQSLRCSRAASHTPLLVLRLHSKTSTLTPTRMKPEHRL